MALSTSRALCTLATVLLALGGSLAGGGVVSGDAIDHAGTDGPAAGLALSAQTLEPAGSPGPCKDDAHHVGAQHWTRTYRWRFRATSTPDEISRADARAAIVRAMGNITNARNDCGMPDRVSARADLLGNTARRPNVRANGTCAQFDGFNTVGFGALPPGIAGVTCWWYTGARIVEADIRLNSTLDWTTKEGGCVSAVMLEAVATHEAGHVFGLRHVGEANHGRLTMSKRLDGPCQNAESTLGRGDVRGLQQLY